jgi:hypothetical protein
MLHNFRSWCGVFELGNVACVADLMSHANASYITVE